MVMIKVLTMIEINSQRDRTGKIFFTVPMTLVYYMYMIFISQVLAFFGVLILEHILCFINEQQKLSSILWSVNLCTYYLFRKKKKTEKKRKGNCLYVSSKVFLSINRRSGLVFGFDMK